MVTVYTAMHISPEDICMHQLTIIKACWQIEPSQQCIGMTFVAKLHVLMSGMALQAQTNMALRCIKTAADLRHSSIIVPAGHFWNLTKQ